MSIPRLAFVSIAFMAPNSLAQMEPVRHLFACPPPSAVSHRTPIPAESSLREIYCEYGTDKLVSNPNFERVLREGSGEDFHYLANLSPGPVRVDWIEEREPHAQRSWAQPRLAPQLNDLVLGGNSAMLLLAAQDPIFARSGLGNSVAIRQVSSGLSEGSPRLPPHLLKPLQSHPFRCDGQYWSVVLSTSQVGQPYAVGLKVANSEDLFVAYMDAQGDRKTHMVGKGDRGWTSPPARLLVVRARSGRAVRGVWWVE